MGSRNSTDNRYDEKQEQRNAEIKKLSPYATEYGFSSSAVLYRKILAGDNGTGGNGYNYGSDKALAKMRQDAKIGKLGSRW